MTPGPPSGSFLELGRAIAIDLVGMALLAAVVAVLVAFGYRRGTTRAAPTGSAILVGLGFLAGWVVLRTLRSGSVVGGLSIEHHVSAGYLLGTFVVAGLTAAAGRRLGDAIACDVYGVTKLAASGEAASLVRSAGLAVELEFPAHVDDAPGYERIEQSVKREIATSSVRLPHRCTLEERRSRLERCLEREYDIDVVDVRIADDGTVDRLSVGRRPSGLGPTVPPGSIAVAIRGDPSPDAAPGDPVEIWTAGSESRLVSTGSVRATNGSIATVVVDADHVDALERAERYRLVTNAAEPTAAHELRSGLRVATETVTTAVVESDGMLAGEFVGWLPGRVLVIDRDDELLPFPDGRETLQGGDELWLLGTPEALGRLEFPRVESSESPKTRNS